MRLLVSVPLLAILACPFALPSGLLVKGRVVDENNVPIPGALIRIARATSGGITETLSDVAGTFEVDLTTGSYTVTGMRDGYFTVQNQSFEVADPPAELQITLNHLREVSESVDVTATASPVDLEGTSSERRVTSAQIMEVPYPATRSFRNALRIMPGIVQDRSGSLHFEGGMENQVYYSLNGFNIGDPITGAFNTRLSVEAVRAFDYATGRYSPEYGKGSAGTLAIQTMTGDDQLRYSATNFIPGVDMRKGLHLGTWAPRFNISGPIRRGRAWFSDNIEGDYSQTVIQDLPTGQDRTTTMRGSNLLHTTINATPTNIVSADLLTAVVNAPNTGLTPLDPISTTIDQRGRQWFAAFKDQIYVGPSTMFEVGYAATRNWLRNSPHGSGYLVMTPDGRSGTYYTDLTQDSSRDQVLLNVYLPAFQFAGTHQLKAGVDLDRVGLEQQSLRTGYENRGAGGRLISRTTFGGNGSVALHSQEASSYIVDAWRPRRNIAIEYGIRQDWDSLIRQFVFSPRVAASWSPERWSHTKISGGYAIVYDASNLSVFARALDQYSIITTFLPDGLPIQSSIMRFRHTSDRLYAPRYQNWTLGFERELPARFRLSASFLRRRGDHGFAYLPDATATPLINTLSLTNERRDAYDSASLTIHQSIGKEYEWMVNYTRSRALSNAVLDVSVDQTLHVLDNYGRLSWDAPNRLLSWGYLPLWKARDWAFAYLLDARSGFPFSVIRDNGLVVGEVNSLRFPFNLDLNLHVERKFRLLSYRFAVRVGVNNVTNSLNATTVNNDMDSPNFMRYYGAEGRHAVVRLRFLGKDSR